MRTIGVREAKAVLSSLVDAAERGEPITITRRGKPAAVIVPVGQARKLFPDKPNFIDFLMGFPGFPEGFEPERDRSSGRDVIL